jgi:hypothetical protein
MDPVFLVLSSGFGAQHSWRKGGRACNFLHDFSHKKNFLHDYNKIKIKEAVQCGIYRRLFLIGDPNIRKKMQKKIMRLIKI